MGPLYSKPTLNTACDPLRHARLAFPQGGLQVLGPAYRVEGRQILVDEDGVAYVLAVAVSGMIAAAGRSTES